jgi:hypothetical protein
MYRWGLRQCRSRGARSIIRPLLKLVELQRLPPTHPKKWQTNRLYLRNSTKPSSNRDELAGRAIGMIRSALEKGNE